MNESASLDMEVFGKLQKLGGSSFVKQLLKLFFEYVPGKIAEARAALDAGNCEAVGHAVHPLKSSAAHVGARRVQELAQQIEQLAKQKRPEILVPLVRELEDAYAEVKPQLEQVQATME